MWPYYSYKISEFTVLQTQQQQISVLLIKLFRDVEENLELRRREKLKFRFKKNFSDDVSTTAMLSSLRN